MPPARRRWLESRQIPSSAMEQLRLNSPHRCLHLTHGRRPAARHLGAQWFDGEQLRELLHALLDHEAEQLLVHRSFVLASAEERDVVRAHRESSMEVPARVAQPELVVDGLHGPFLRGSPGHGQFGIRPCPLRPVPRAQGSCASRKLFGVVPPMFTRIGSRSLFAPVYFTTPSMLTSSPR